MRFKKQGWLLGLAMLALQSFGAGSAEPVFLDDTHHPVRFSELKGHWVFLHEWASWCPHCRHDVQVFNELYSKYQGRVKVYGINYDHVSESELQKIVASWNIHHPNLLQDPGTYLHLQDTGMVPVTYVFDPNGHLYKVLQGPQSLRDLERVMS